MNRSIKHIVLAFPILLFIGFGYAWGCQFFPALPGYHSLHYTHEYYEQEQKSIQLGKTSLSANLLMEGDDATVQKGIISQGAKQFQDGLDGRLFPYWLGTSYDFYGTSQVPGRGEIACGYFVTTVLEDMGVALDRVALARMASESMIKSLVAENYIRRYSNQSLNRLLFDVRNDGQGIYIVGLDTHTGFLVNDGEECYFIHASGRYPWRVVEEVAEESAVLTESVYRVTGHITGDSAFIAGWLEE